jgi:hypothetical protein
MSAGAGPCSHASVGGLDSLHVKPRVLIISERPNVRESACVLVGTMECQCVVASRIEDALTNLEVEKASAAILDLPSAVSDPASMSQNFSQLLGRLQGRLVVLIDQTSTVEIGDLEKKYSIPFVQRDRLAVDLWPCLAALTFSHPGIRRITQTARLVLDTFLQPQPAGIRSPRTGMRQLVYEMEHFTADISLEHPPNSTQTTVVGQIMRDADPRIPLSGVPVVIKGEKGTIEMKMTNQSGEFLFVFENEPKVTFEIEVNHGHWIAIVSPILKWDRAAASGLN